VAPLDPGFVRYLAVAAPLVAGVTLLTVDEWYGRWFGQLGGEGTIASLAYARRLMLVPVAVIGQTLATAALPTLSRLWSESRRDELDDLVRRTLEVGLALGVLGAAATWALATPLVTLVYQRGAFGADDTVRVAAALQIYALAIPAWIAQQIAVRPFYARGDTWRPMLLGSFLAVAAVPLYRALASAGAPGLAAAGALAIGASAVATVALARAQHGAPRLGALAATTLRAAAVGVAVALAVRAAQRGRPGAFGALVDLAAGGAAFLAAASAGALFASGPATRDAWLAFARGALRRLPGRAGR
jgi:putative peptidoglycan lipid II flippase